MSEWLTVSVPNIVGLIANLVTITVLVSGFLLIQQRSVARSLQRSRARAFRKAGVPSFPDDAIAERMRSLLEDTTFTVAEEVEWLTSSLGKGKSADYSLPLLLSPEKIAALARGYELDAAALNSRVILSANRVPLIAECIELSKKTARYLHDLVSARTLDGSFLPTPAAASVHIPHRGVTIRPHLFPDRTNNSLAYDLIVSWRAHLTAPSQERNRWLDTEGFNGFTWLPISDDEHRKLTERFTRGHQFDGYLPRLVRWERQYDTHSGRLRLHIAIAACSYSAVIMEHYPGEAQAKRLSADHTAREPQPQGVRSDREVDGLLVNLLTLSLVPVTRDGYLVLAERSAQAGSYQGMFGPGVNGNLELHARRGSLIDADDAGIPDPRRALAREALEELGLRIEPESIAITGLVSFDAPIERRTNLLMATVMLPLTLAELATQSGQADLIEGRWEMGRELLGIRLSHDDQDLAQISSWLVNSPLLMPHATAATLAALSAFRTIPAPDTIPIDPNAPEPDASLLCRVQMH